MADTKGQYTAWVSNLVYECEGLKTEDAFAGDSRPGLLDYYMVDDESEREGRVGLPLLSRLTQNKNSEKPICNKPTATPRDSVSGEL